MWAQAAQVAKTSAFVGTASLTGDLLCQSYEVEPGASPEYDAPRSARMAITGAFVLAPMSITWNTFAEKTFKGPSPRMVLGRLGIMLACMPIMVGSQFTSLTLLEKGKTMDDAISKCDKELVPTLKRGFVYWTVIGGLVYPRIPVTHRPIAGSIAGVLWNGYVSLQNNKAVDAEIQKDLEEFADRKGIPSISAPAVLSDESEPEESEPEVKDPRSKEAVKGRMIRSQYSFPRRTTAVTIL
ncbi:unnamed protein product [Chrysoparadoxa australica]